MVGCFVLLPPPPLPLLPLLLPLLPPPLLLPLLPLLPPPHQLAVSSCITVRGGAGGHGGRWRWVHGKKNGHFLRHLYIKMIILPRQTRDKHREHSTKDAFLQVQKATGGGAKTSTSTSGVYANIVATRFFEPKKETTFPGRAKVQICV
jgi:hypothetical protein